MSSKKTWTAAQINAMPKTARPIGVEEISEQDFIKKYADRVRRGKTAKNNRHHHGKDAQAPQSGS